MTWREFWNADTPIYVSERHKQLHYALIASDLVALVDTVPAGEGSKPSVLDHGCGEALAAGRLAARCASLFLCDGAPLVRDRLLQRFGANGRITILAPEELGRIPDNSLDLVVANSLLQYLSRNELASLLTTWKSKLKGGGRLVLADVIPPTNKAADDVGALLAFAWRGGFLGAAVAGLARTLLSDYRKLRAQLGLATYAETEIAAILRDAGFDAARRATNIGPNPKRMTIVATSLA